MIPNIDLVVKEKIQKALQRLIDDPNKVDEFFSHSSRQARNDMKRFLQEYEIFILSGYPREPKKLPCIIVMISGEEEVDYGLGDGIDEGYDKPDNYLDWSPEVPHYIQENAQMHVNIRVELWSDNAVITSFLYSIAKYCLLSSKYEMQMEGYILPTISGGDLEPVPDYFPIFVYRKSATFSFDYVISYHVGDLEAGKEEDHFPLGTTIDDIGIKFSGGLDGKED